MGKSHRLTPEYRRAWYARHPLYPTWNFMRRVCGLIRGRTEKEASLYAGIGVSSAFDRYADFEAFVLGLGWKKGLFVVRTDKTGDFAPGNLAVAPYSEAVNMRRNTKRIDGVPFRKIFGGKGHRGDQDYRRASDRYFKLGFDLQSSLSKAVVPIAENGLLAHRRRADRKTSE